MSSATSVPLASPIRLLDLARELRETFEDRDALRRDIAAYLQSPAAAPRLSALGRAFLIDPSDFRELLRNSEPLLALCWGEAADMHGQRIPAQVAVSADAARHVRAEAFIAAVVEGNATGEIHEGLIRFDAKELAALVVRLEGGIGVRGRLERERERASHAATLEPAASVDIENVSIVPRGAPALGAVGAALDGFVFPWQIPSLFRESKGGSPLQGRIVRMGGTRSISIGGRFRWARALLALATDDADPVSLGGGVAAGARFTAKLEGDFQIVVEPRGERRVAVSVSRRRISDRRFHASATAYLGLEGSERVARLVLERLAGDAARVLASIEEHPERWTDLRALFHAAAEERLDRALASSPVAAEIEEWLRSVATRVDLRRRLRRLAAEVLGEAAAEAIDAIENEIAPAIEVVRALVIPLHRGLSRIRGAIDAAARSRLEIELALSRNRSETTEVAFSFDLDPVAAEPLYLEMLRGEFALAFRLAEAGSDEVRLEGGSSSRSGTLEIESSLTIVAFGAQAGTSTLLSQEWDTEIAATGDVLIGVRSSLQEERKRWRSVRAARVLVESALLARLDERERLAGPDGDDLMTIESEIEFEPSDEELREFERRMISLGALDAPTSMHRDLLVERKRLGRHPFGKLEAVAVLRLSWQNVQALAAADTPAARATFARHLYRWAPPPAIPGKLSNDGLPLFAWPSVLQWAGDPWPDSSRAIRFHDSAATLHADVPAGHPSRALFLYARTVLFFERALLQLRTMAAAPPDALEVEQLSRRLRREHRSLLRELGVVVGFVDSAIGEVLFRTLLDLLPPDHQAETYLVVRREDGRRFVYQ